MTYIIFIASDICHAYICQYVKITVRTQGLQPNDNDFVVIFTFIFIVEKDYKDNKEVWRPQKEG